MESQSLTMGTVTEMHLTRLKAGHYIHGYYSITRHYDEDTVTWTVRHRDGEVWTVENLDKARELVTKLREGK
jgi:aminoglycoside N3'-acetyltransferase